MATARIEHNLSRSIENYILSCGEIPAWGGRNRDGTMVVSEFEMVVSKNYPTALVVGDLIDAFISQTSVDPFFMGEITEVVPDNDAQTYIVKVASILISLTRFTVDRDTLHLELTQTLQGNEYIASDNFSLPNAQVLWVIKCMMRIAFNYSGYIYVNFLVDTTFSSKFIKAIDYEEVTRNMNMAHVVIDENVLYCLNQSVAINDAGISASAERCASRITFFDFISEFCSNFNGQINISTYYTKYIELTEKPSGAFWVDDKYLLSQSIDKVVGQSGGHSDNLLFNATRSTYDSSTPSSLANHETVVGEGVNMISTMNNLCYMFRKYWGNVGDVLGHVYPDYMVDSTIFLAEKIDSTIENYTVNEAEVIQSNNLILPFTGRKSVLLDIDKNTIKYTIETKD